MLCLCGFELYSRWVPLKQLQTIANQAVIPVIKLLRILKLTGGNCCEFPQGKRIQGNLTRFKESVISSVVYVLFINRFKLLGFN